jgi:hypothetical protein
MRLRATLLAALAIASWVAATPADTAVIVNSGSTNSYGFTIQVWSNGKGSLALKGRGGAAGTAKPFSLSAATTARFFADLAAARKANAATAPCVKSASFGTSTHVTWQGWQSPDLSCPPNGSVGEALVRDVDAIRQAAGVSQPPLRGAAGPIGPTQSEPPR